MEIAEVLNRRSDLSTFVVHFTRDFGGRQAKANLESILRETTIWAETRMGWLGGVPADQQVAAKVVCFSETPLEHAYSLVQAAAVIPFVEQMGTWTSTEKEFWWEREWRHRGDFSFSAISVTLVFCPEAEIEEMEDFGWPAVDPSWSLERMIEKLAHADLGSPSQRRTRRRERLQADVEEASAS
jgi:hypothetical protein